MTIVHLDSAACGRTSQATRDALAAHLRREAETGGYVAEVEAAATLEHLRADLAGLLDVDPDGVAFTSSAESALGVLLDAWHLPAGGSVGVVPSEYGPNLDQLEAHGYGLTVLAVDEAGLVDRDRLAAAITRGDLAAVHLVQVPAHRGLEQPVAEVGELCRAAGAPLWVDAAQACGQTQGTAGADAVYGTSRKWLRGPRGVGFLGVRREALEELTIPPHPRFPEGTPALRRVELEADIAARVGLAQAVGELVASGAGSVAGELRAVGERTRAALADLPGWQVVPAQTGPITALRPLAGQDVVRTRAWLLEEAGILTTASLPWRAPLELGEGWLRVSPHVDVRDEELEALARALNDA